MITTNSPLPRTTTYKKKARNLHTRTWGESKRKSAKSRNRKKNVVFPNKAITWMKDSRS